MNSPSLLSEQPMDVLSSDEEGVLVAIRDVCGFLRTRAGVCSIDSILELLGPDWAPRVVEGPGVRQTIQCRGLEFSLELIEPGREVPAHAVGVGSLIRVRFGANSK